MAAKAPRSDAMTTLLASAQKKYNMHVGSMDAVADDIVAVTTGNMAIDYAIGIGGFPLGRSVELYGNPSCGKTTTALQVCVAVQRIIMAGGDPKLGIKADDVIFYMDYEQAMDKEYAKKLGLDVNHESFMFAQPDTLEEGANFCLAALATGRARLFVFDSVAGMTPSAKSEADIGKSLPAVQAKLMKDFGDNLKTSLAKNNGMVIFLNHQMEAMGMGARPGMPPTITTPGGKALKYFASVRIQYTRVRENLGTVIDPLSMEEMQLPLSTDVKIKVTKNKVAPPFRTAIVRVRYGKGFDNFWTAIQVLLANKKLVYASGYYYFEKVAHIGLAPDWMKRQTTGTHRPYILKEERVFKAGDDHPEWRQGLIELAEQVVSENADALELVVKTDEMTESEEEDEEIDALLEGASSGGQRAEL